MDERFHSETEKIDIASWERKPLFEVFGSYAEPYHSVCVRVDCTETFQFAKDHRLSVFLSMLHRTMVAAHQVRNFRMRIVNDEVLLYKTIHAGSAVGRDDETIGFAYYVFDPKIDVFVKNASREVDAVKARRDLVRHPAQNLIRFSVLPWLDFTSLSHAREFSLKDSAPRITFGKITEAQGRRSMPVSIHVHHALVDGLHLGRFVEAFEQALASPESN